MPVVECPCEEDSHSVSSAWHTQRQGCNLTPKSITRVAVATRGALLRFGVRLALILRDSKKCFFETLVSFRK